MAGRARIFQMARRTPLQNARPNPAREIPALRDLPELRGIEVEDRGAQRSRRRIFDRRRGPALSPRLDRMARHDCQTARGCGARRRRDARTAQPRRLPARSRARLSHRRAPGAHPIGRRGAADTPRDRTRQRAGRHPLRARRADCGTSCGGCAAAARRAASSARFRQHGGRRRARSRDDLWRRSRRRARTGRRQRRRTPDLFRPSQRDQPG